MLDIRRIERQELPGFVSQPEVARLLAERRENLAEIGVAAAKHFVISVQSEARMRWNGTCRGIGKRPHPERALRFVPLPGVVDIPEMNDDLGVPGQVRLDRLKAPVDLVAVPEDGQRASQAPRAAPAVTRRRLRHARWRRPAAAGSAGSAGGPWGLAVMLLMAEMQSWRSQASSTGAWPRLAPVSRTPGVSRKQLVQQHEVGVAIPARAHDVREVLAQPARYRVLVALLGPAARLLAGPDSGTS